MANPRLKHTYIRVDASGRDINNTNVSRLKKPVTGRWRLVPSAYCCAASILTSTPADVSLTSINFELLCDAVTIATHTIATATTTIEELVAALNGALSYYGTFSVSGIDVNLNFNGDVKNGLCPGVLTFEITETV